jgi:hypothetical protein
MIVKNTQLFMNFPFSLQLTAYSLQLTAYSLQLIVDTLKIGFQLT